MTPKRTTRTRASSENSERTVGITPAWLAKHPLPVPDAGGDKDARGAVLVVGGALELPGAVVLAGIAALRAGAGKLQIASCRDVVPHIGTAVPEALVASLPQTKAGGIAPEAAADIVRRAEMATVLLLGPGMVEDETVVPIAREAVRGARTPQLVLDAAALVVIPQIVSDVRDRGGRLVLTPHAKEFARMREVKLEEVQAHPRELAEEAARELRAVVVLKGATTYIAADGERTHRYAAGDVGLATSGSGDTLAGVVAGLLARGTDPFIAACWSVALHGAAGAALARRIGRIGYLARELLDEIPRAMAQAGRRRSSKG